MSDAFTRYRDPQFADRGVVLKEVDGKPHYFFGERAHPIIPGPGDVHPRPRPGALYDYFAGKSSKERVGNELACEDPAEHPEWFDRDARLACMDAQGVEAAWLFPSQGVCMEGPMQPDIEASIEILRAFNRWLDDDWGFAYQDRIFAVPFLTLSDLDRAVERTRVVPRPWRTRSSRFATARSSRPKGCGPRPIRPSTPSGRGSRRPASSWRRTPDSKTATPMSRRTSPRTWGMTAPPEGERRPDAAAVQSASLVAQLMKHRLIEDFATVLVAHKLFERFPRLRVAYIENGADWVPRCLHTLRMLAGQNPGMFASDPAEQFIEHCWVAPFVEDNVDDLARHLPVERILFGSDWPHAEGLAQPRDFFANVASFSLDDQRKIMVENARSLTFA